jgi:hypothetical protein
MTLYHTLRTQAVIWAVLVVAALGICAVVLVTRASSDGRAQRAQRASLRNDTRAPQVVERPDPSSAHAGFSAKPFHWIGTTCSGDPVPSNASWRPSRCTPSALSRSGVRRYQCTQATTGFYRLADASAPLVYNDSQRTGPTCIRAKDGLWREPLTDQVLSSAYSSIATTVRIPAGCGATESWASNGRVVRDPADSAQAVLELCGVPIVLSPTQLIGVLTRAARYGKQPILILGASPARQFFHRIVSTIRGEVISVDNPTGGWGNFTYTVRQRTDAYTQGDKDYAALRCDSSVDARDRCLFQLKYIHSPFDAANARRLSLLIRNESVPGPAVLLYMPHYWFLSKGGAYFPTKPTSDDFCDILNDAKLPIQEAAASILERRRRHGNSTSSREEPFFFYAFESLPGSVAKARYSPPQVIRQFNAVIPARNQVRLEQVQAASASVLPHQRRSTTFALVPLHRFVTNGIGLAAFDEFRTDEVHLICAAKNYRAEESLTHGCVGRFDSGVFSAVVYSVYLQLELLTSADANPPP